MLLPKPTKEELSEITMLFRHIGPDNALTQYLSFAREELGRDIDVSEGEMTHKLQGARRALQDLMTVINAATEK